MPKVTAAPIGTSQGTAPHLLLAVTFSSGFLFYATKDLDIAGTIYTGAIMECGNIRSEIKKGSAATVASVSMKLSDSDGSVKLALDSSIFEKATASLFVYYEGDVPGNEIPMIKGNIAGPVTWDETQRTCSFSIESFIEDQDVGFAPTVDDFSDLDPTVAGIPWPMIFGKCAHVPALKVHKKVQGSLLMPCRLFNNDPLFLDDTLPHRQDLILNDTPTLWSFTGDDTGWEQTNIYIDNLVAFPASSSSSHIKIIINDVYFKGYADDTDPQKFIITDINVPKYTNLHFGARTYGSSDAFDDRQNYNVAWLADDGISIANCGCYLTTSPGKIWYNFCEHQEGRKCFFRNPFMDPANHKTKIFITASQTIAAVYPISKTGLLDDVESAVWEAKVAFDNVPNKDSTKTWYGLLKREYQNLAHMATAWWHAESDAVVMPVVDDADLYIASLVQLTAITAVYGKRKIKTPDNKTKTIFCPIPKTYYTIQLTSSYTVAGQLASAVIFTTPLSDYKGMGWEDDIYITAESTVGPNACDIIKFIIENFTDLTVDSAAYTAAKASTRDANFALFDKRNALAVCEEIAWQSRVGLLLEGGKIVMRFLATVPTSAINILNDDNIDLENGINLGFTPIKEIVTKIVGTWTADYKDSKQSTHLNHAKTKEVENVVRSIVPPGRRSFSATQYSIYQNNEDKFGTHAENHNVYIFNNKQYTDEVIKFWGYRQSNCWRRARIRAFADSLVFECWDTATITIADAGVFNFSGAFTALVVATELNWKDMSVYLDVEIPIKAGTQTDSSSDYWPGNS